MHHPRRNALLLILVASLCLASPMAWAEAGFLVLHVKDVQQHPVANLEIGVEGDGGSGATDSRGKVRIKLAPQTTVKSWVSLQIEKSPPGKDWVMVSPWERRTLVPSFENESENFVEVVVMQRGDRAALESGTVLKAAVQQINKANALKSADKQAAQENPKANLEAVAKQFGLSPEDLDKAIRAWGAKTTDPYDAGLAALYERNYSKATADLQDSLKQREEKLASDQKAVADAAFFLGESLFWQEKYKESVVAYQRCLQIRPDDPVALNLIALDLELAGDYVGAVLPMQRALAIREKALGPESPMIALDLLNLGDLLSANRDYAGAETLYRRALAIDEKALGPDHEFVVLPLNKLADLLWAKGDYAGAEAFMRRALVIDEKAGGPDDPVVATDLSNLAALLGAKRDYVGAEPLLRRALAIDEKAMGSDDPDVATVLNNLAVLLYLKGDYAGAEPLMRRALAIDEKALGPDDPQTQQDQKNLDDLLQKSAQAAVPKAKP